MSITALTGVRQQVKAGARPHPLLSVMAWEFRRFRASRLFWLQALGFFCLLLLVTWAQGTTDQLGISHGKLSLNGFIAGTSALGLVNTLPSSSLVLLIFLLPFITTDGVTRDLQRRTHELLMTTALPIRAYVWGRYLMGLILSLGLAVLLFAAILSMGLLLHLTVQDYPLPQVNALLLLWGGIVLPATVLVSSLSFALGTLLPRLSSVVKVVILLAWIIGAIVIPIGMREGNPPGWYVTWDPTGAVTALGMQHQYVFSNISANISSNDQFQQALLAFENAMPQIGNWLAAHLLLAGVGLLLVLVAALAFKRTQDALN
ncbi:MAG TPA: ABC transporter permease [Ktedonobacteraceae bacterium]|nr:ABC transporter permease [Ktedonobacteraceae bacterium]